MEIPERCRGCKNLQDILGTPVKDMATRLRESTGKRVHSYGGNALRSSALPPEKVMFTDGSWADEAQISSAFYGEETDRADKERTAADFVDGCPGELNGRVTIEGTEKIVPICGKIALLT